MTEIHPLPTRAPNNRAMAATLKLLQWQAPEPGLLRRMAADFGALNYPTRTCTCRDMINGYAHAHQIMAVHAEHRCPRYTAAYERTQQERP
jgi:hypothetical protein